MKFMKLGSKPDNSFHVDHQSNSIRCVSSDLATDFTVIVDHLTFYLHKFPLLSKSNRLQKLALNENNSDVIHLTDFPSGPKTFEICAKFCYGITVSVSPYNLVAVRCAAEYLEMTEDIDKGNLIFKLDVFFKSVLRSWKDTIIVLQTTTAHQQWCEDIEITERCIESIASKTGTDLSCVNWSYTYNRKLDAIVRVSENQSVPKDWWIEDLCELDIDVYKRVICAVIAKKRVDGDVIGEALKTYCLRWLPDCSDGFESDELGHVEKYKMIVESIIWLLKLDKVVNCSCSFLLKLLKVAILVGVDVLLRDDLIRNVSWKLDEATVPDLLIPVEHSEPQATVYDVKLVQHLVDRFFDRKRGGSDVDVDDKDDDDDEKNDLVMINYRRCMIIGRLVDGYLSEVACDRNLSIDSFMMLSRCVPDAGRPVHDGIYSAVDVYLKEHTTLTKIEKKKLCELIDVKKLSPNACIHAAQNDRLPLRMVVQILFNEQARATAAIKNAARASKVQEQDWEIKLPLRSKSLRTPSRLKLNESDVEKQVAGVGSMRLIPSRSRRILDKFWMVGMGQRNGESKSTGTSGSSQSKSSSGSSRKQRYSIS
ncbi:phototropic-responsive NPH3 family protein NPY1-like [Rutidosis leptorrhynchoides]|uniref:phototropic-responsive NPH3 family protein NPY1-like n=1 Tax=Rutidosis leptorrhynchoides TaxID=125765 RepID=UPI003A99917E